MTEIRFESLFPASVLVLLTAISYISKSSGGGEASLFLYKNFSVHNSLHHII